MIENFPQHRDPDAKRKLTRSTEGIRSERIVDREDFENQTAENFETQSALDAAANTRFSARLFTTGEPFYFPPHARFEHMWAIGKTGSGKSNWLKTMALADIEAGHGVWYIDPHGDDFAELKDAIPPSRVEDVCLFDAADIHHAVSFNPVADIPFFGIPVAASMMAEGIRDTWYGEYSARMHSQVYHALVVLMEKPLTTLDDLPLLFYKLPKEAPLEMKQRQAWLFRDIKHSKTSNFWRYEFPKYPYDAPVAILARINQLLASPHAMAILNHHTSAFKVADAIAEGKVVLVNLSQGIIGNTASSLIGCFLVSEYRRAIMARAGMAIEDRMPVYGYIDEFQNFATLSLEQLLSGSRKYKLALTFANQYTAQLDPKVLAALKGNVATLIAFHIGDDDAEDLGGEFSFPNDALTAQSRGRARVKYDLATYAITTEPFVPTTTGSSAAVEHHSRRKYFRRV